LPQRRPDYVRVNAGRRENLRQLLASWIRPNGEGGSRSRRTRAYRFEEDVKFTGNGNGTGTVNGNNARLKRKSRRPLRMQWQLQLQRAGGTPALQLQTLRREVRSWQAGAQQAAPLP
jgi:hypothetical protein